MIVASLISERWGIILKVSDPNMWLKPFTPQSMLYSLSSCVSSKGHRSWHDHFCLSTQIQVQFFLKNKTVSDNFQFVFGKNIAKYRCIFDVFVLQFELSILLVHHLDVLLTVKIILSEHLEIHMLTWCYKLSPWVQYKTSFCSNFSSVE